MTFTSFTGESGISYPFEVFLDGTEFNPVSGVYVFIRVTGGLLGQIPEALYVGETESLQNRLNTYASSHDGLKRSREAGMTYIGVYRCEGSPKRLRVETDLRHALDPVCNRQSVPRSLADSLYPNT